jgi:sulfur-oxidizing protein SoxY
MTPRLAWRCAVAVVALFVAMPLHAADLLDTEVWERLRAGLFGGRDITSAPPGLIELRVPPRAADAAVVPVAVRIGGDAASPLDVRTLTLVIDRNPSPIAAVVRFGAGAASADLETRVRVEDYTPVRVIVELADGRLLMAARYVKAAGGCSAPAGTADAGPRIGRTRLVFDEDPTGRPAGGVRWSMIHPNHSGLAMDQSSRLYTPAWYVRTVRVMHAGVLVLEADVDFSLSENPSLRFVLARPEAGGTLTAEVIDTRDRRYDAEVAVPPADGSGSVVR